MTPAPLGSVVGVESLVLFGAQIFQIFYNLFHHQNVPTSAASAMAPIVAAVPGVTADHMTVATAAITAAAAHHDATTAAATPPAPAE